MSPRLSDPNPSIRFLQTLDYPSIKVCSGLKTVDTGQPSFKSYILLVRVRPWTFLDTNGFVKVTW